MNIYFKNREDSCKTNLVTLCLKPSFIMRYKYIDNVHCNALFICINNSLLAGSLLYKKLVVCVLFFSF